MTIISHTQNRTIFIRATLAQVLLRLDYQKKELMADG